MPSNPVPRFIIRPPGASPYVLTLEQLTAHVRAARVLRMGRLADKLARASNAIATLEIAVEKDVDKIVQRAAEVDAKRENVTHRHLANLDSHMTDLSEFERDLEDFGKNVPAGLNGGDAYAGTRKDG